MTMSLIKALGELAKALDAIEDGDIAYAHHLLRQLEEELICSESINQD